ncbi:hypothetical protein [Bacillus norwichensis]|uniref:Uncharacterized protein n=1 Tax=Bacillus norwichensis TaxID=2762217 RepID=A0ABR8VPD3_9BACI|nr:hypothetical protein [Bacillus norwichensis]MBD8006577.1 hypothetical protein [Bacillus norwichensis]
MGLYFNEEEQYIYKSEETIDEPNQSVAQIDEWSEFFEAQKKSNTRLQQAFFDLNKVMKQQDQIRKNQWKKINYQLKDLRRNDRKHAEDYENVKGQLTIIDEKNHKLEVMLEQEIIFKKEVMEQLLQVSGTNAEIEQRLKSVEVDNEELLAKLNQQYELQKEMTEQISKQEERHQEVMSRLDSQEAVTEKILRQVTNIRSILFERANYLAEKIENSYQLTSSYIYKLMSGSVEPLQLFLLKQKGQQKESEEQKQ